MDRFDAGILNALQQDANAMAEALSRQADFRSMPAANGWRAFAQLASSRLRSPSSIPPAPEVMQCYYVTGNADFVLILSAHDMTDYEAFTRRHFFAEDNALRFRTSAVMDRVKTGYSIPVESD